MHPEWSELPQHLLDLILERLELPSTYLRFSVVCKSWYSTAKENEKARAKMLSRGRYPPMLLIYTNENNSWSLYNVMEDKVLDTQLEVPNIYKRFCGSSKGWLIAIDDNLAVSLINPFLRVKGRKAKENSIIHLPCLTPASVTQREFWVKKYELFVHKATITADPIMNPDDCIVVVIYMELNRLAFIRLKKDTTWTYIAADYKSITEVAYIDRKFYAVNYWSKMLCFDITSDQSNPDIEIIAANGVDRSRKWNTLIYLMESNIDGEFLLVHRYVDSEDEGHRETKNFRVFALDYSNSTKFEWREKNLSGDVALFLGDNSSMCTSASKFPGCKPNCIYFNDDRDTIDDYLQPSDFGVYNFGNHEISFPYNNRAKKLMKSTERYPIWILPTVYQL